MKASPLLLLASLLAVWPASARVWTDDQGREVDAEFVELDGATVRLRLKSGKISSFPLAKLSAADQQWIRGRDAAPEPPAKPAPAPAALPQVDWSPLKEGGDRAPAVPAPPEPPAQALIAVSDFIGGARLYLKPDGSDAFPHLKFTTVSPFSDDRAWVKTAEHQGYINREGRFVIGGDSDVPLPEGGDRFGPFSCGLARFQRGEFAGFLDTGGKVAIAPDRFRRAKDFSEDLAAVSIDSGGLQALADAGLGPWFFIDRSGKTVIEGPFSNPQPFRGGVSWVCTQPPETQGPYAVINRQGGLVPGFLKTRGRPEWTPAGGYIAHERTVLTREGRTVIDWDGKNYLITALPEEGPLAFAKVRNLHPGFLRLVHLPSLTVYGPPIKGSFAQSFHEGLAPVSFPVDGTTRWGCVDTRGNTVIPPRFTDPPVFREGMALVRLPFDTDKSKVRMVVINRQGEVIWEGKTRD
jgi:hypothetical protein